MDTFTRNYLIGLSMILLVAFGLWLANYSFRVGELNNLLENEPFLADYPYQFRVLSLNNGVAELASPRSASMPAIKFLAIVYPDLKGKSPQNPILIEAQKELAERQAFAKRLMLQQADISSVNWTLDRDWYAKNDVYLETYR